jgi:hypothetical protein
VLLSSICAVTSAAALRWRRCRRDARLARDAYGKYIAYAPQPRVNYDAAYELRRPRFACASARACARAAQIHMQPPITTAMGTILTACAREK